MAKAKSKNAKEAAKIKKQMEDKAANGDCAFC